MHTLAALQPDAWCVAEMNFVEKSQADQILIVVLVAPNLLDPSVPPTGIVHLIVPVLPLIT